MMMIMIILREKNTTNCLAVPPPPSSSSLTSSSIFIIINTIVDVAVVLRIHLISLRLFHILPLLSPLPSGIRLQTNSYIFICIYFVFFLFFLWFDLLSIAVVFWFHLILSNILVCSISRLKLMCLSVSKYSKHMYIVWMNYIVLILSWKAVNR